MLVLVVGPSGAGKDSLLNAARDAFRDDPRVHFARRVITRPADPMGENHEPVTETEFDRRDLALTWSAHGLRYGIPTEALTAAPVVVVNVSRGVIADVSRGVIADVSRGVIADVSRGVIADAAARSAVRVLEVTAPPDVLAARLAARGRESAEDVARRLRRAVAIPESVQVETVMNDATLAEGAARFIAALRRIVTDSPA